MPDESTNPVGTAQIPQDNQATTNQTGDDFVLDFGEGSNVEGASTSEESENMDTTLEEDNKEEPQSDMNLDFDGGELFNDNKKGENEENNIVIQDLDTIFSESQNEGFDISLGEDTKKEEKNDIIEESPKVEDNLTGMNEVKEGEKEVNQNIEEKVDGIVDNEVLTDETDNKELVSDESDDNEMVSDEATNQEPETQEVVNQDDKHEDTVGDVFADEITEEKIDENDTLPLEVEDKEEIKSEADNQGLEDITTQTDEISNDLTEDINISDDTNEEIGDNPIISENDSEDKLINDDSEEETRDIQGFEEESVVAQNEEVPETQNEEVPDATTDLIDNENISEDDNQEAIEEIQDTNDTKTDLILDPDLFQEEVSSEATVNSENNNENVDLQVEDKEEQVENKNQQNTEDVNMDLSADSLEEGSENEPRISDNGEGNTQIETKIEDKEIETQEKKPENLDFVMDFNLEEETPQQEVKQPEIGDLMGDMNFSLDEPSTNEENMDSQVDESFDTVENITNSVMENINNAENTNLESNTNSEIKEEPENNIPNSESLTDVTTPKVDIQDQNIEENLGNVVENQEESDLPQSSENSISQEIPTHDLNNQPETVVENNTNQQSIIEENNATTEFNLQQSQAEQINNFNEVKNNINETNVPEKVEDNFNKPVKSTDVATLSLDQILDSELNSNPQYADNSKAVPKNVPSNSGFFSKKTVGIIAAVLLFGLAGYVAVLAFPSKNTDRKPLDVVPNTGDQDHYAGYDPTEPEEYPEIEETKTNTGNSGINPVKTQVSFPDVEGGDGESGSEEPENKEPEPYYCIDEDCLEEPEIEVTTDKLSAEEIMPIISDYKSSAEKYYSLGDESQDKKLIKYALQIINLCDSYQSQVENEEGATQESLDDFKSQFKTLMSKMEKYVGGGEEVQTFIQSNFEEEYNFPGKDEYKEYINNRDNY